MNTNPLHRNDDGETALHVAVRTYKEDEIHVYSNEMVCHWLKRLIRICTLLLGKGGRRIAEAADKKRNKPFEMALGACWIGCAYRQ